VRRDRARVADNMAEDQLDEQVETFQNLLISYATGGKVANTEYQGMRRELLARLREKMPRFVRVNSDLTQLWAHFKQVSGSYQGRREYIWKEFGPLLGELQGAHAAPTDARVTEALDVLSSDAVKTAWERALERRMGEPDAAITSARTLLETVCKHILDDLNVSYPPDADLPKLYRLTAESLKLAPGQQTEPILKQVLGGCTAVVEGVGAMRNKLGDAHGKGRAAEEVEPRHASLAVNLAGAAATFLVETWEGQRRP
jgi:Abortive infection C-terminus